MLTTISNTFSLSWTLFARTVGAKYRKSFLGYFWMVAPALIVSLGACLAYSAGILHPGATTVSYPVFVFIGALIWQSFAETATLAHQAIEGARSYLTRVNFPREAVILAQCYETVFVTCVRISVAILFMALAGSASLYGILVLIVSTFLAVLLGLAFSMLTMPFTLLFSDLHNAVKLALSYGIFITPALYAPGGEGIFSAIIKYNPVSPLMQAARDAASGTQLTAPVEFYIVVGACMALPLLGVALVRIATPIILERMLIGGR